jgi:hypothetical protein
MHVLMPLQQNAEQNHNMKGVTTCFENAAKLK